MTSTKKIIFQRNIQPPRYPAPYAARANNPPAIPVLKQCDSESIYVIDSIIPIPTDPASAILIAA